MTFATAGYLQFEVQPGDIPANLDAVRTGLNSLVPQRCTVPTLVVLPELWATGFVYSELPRLARQTDSLLDTLAGLAAERHIHIAGSLPEVDAAGSGTRYYNTLFLVAPDGSRHAYRKQRLFAPMAEDTFFSPGSHAGPLHTTAGPVAALVCYDLRFPELLRGQAAAGATLLVISAQWPMARKEHWQTLVRARAIENQIFVIACNSCGSSGGTQFAGHSMIVAPDGTLLAAAHENAAADLVGLDPEILHTTRARFNTLQRV